MLDLTDRTALVTGASGGIGRAVACALHACGAVVGISGRRETELASLAAGLGDRVQVLPCDLSDRAAVAGLVARAGEALGSVDILVNNAGLTLDNLAVRMTDEEWDRVLEVNLGAAFRLARGVLRGMMKRRWGRIVSITSVVGHTGNPGQVNYTASKAALAALTKSLALEVASRGITVNAVAPGLIETAMTAGLDDTQRERILARVPLGRFGAAEEVAAAVVYLASPEAGYVTGQTLHINGGLAMV